MYEVRFITPEGKETLMLFTPFLTEAVDAIEMAQTVDYARAEIWADDKCIRCITRLNLANDNRAA